MTIYSLIKLLSISTTAFFLATSNHFAKTRLAAISLLLPPLYLYDKYNVLHYTDVITFLSGLLVPIAAPVIFFFHVAYNYNKTAFFVLAIYPLDFLIKTTTEKTGLNKKLIFYIRSVLVPICLVYFTLFLQI